MSSDLVAAMPSLIRGTLSLDDDDVLRPPLVWCSVWLMRALDLADDASWRVESGA